MPRRGDLTRFDKDLARVIKATETMQNLLNDLLELSRVGRIIKPLEDVAFGEIVQEALNLIVNPLHPGDVKIEVQENFPVVHCDRTRIIEVIQNLLSNCDQVHGQTSLSRRFRSVLWMWMLQPGLFNLFHQR